VIPEAVFSKRNYLNAIYEKIKADVAPYDPTGIMNPIWVNSRGAIARFDRGSIEIRLVDSQECPAAELAIVTLLIETVKALVREKFISHEAQMKWKTDQLVAVFNKTVEIGQQAELDDDYTKIFSYTGKTNAGELWRHVLNLQIASGNTTLEKWKPDLDVILKEGNLSTRILKATGTSPSHEKIVEVYRHLADCLAQNKMFYP
jgi:carboxylate-amine ligase